jgi:hypothetical protein
LAEAQLPVAGPEEAEAWVLAGLAIVLQAPQGS